MNHPLTTNSLMRELIAELKELSPWDRLSCLLFVLRIYVRNLNVRWMKKQIAKAMLRRKP